MARKKSAVNEHVRANREKHKRLKAELEAAIAEETNPKHLKKLADAMDKVIDLEERFGLDPFTVITIIAILVKVLKWWFKLKGKVIPCLD